MVTYGFLRGLRPLFESVRSEQRDYVYLDNGYFRPSAHGRQDYSGYYRVTRNALQHDGGGKADPHRFEMLGKRIDPWKRGGRYVMICPPGDTFGELNGFSSAKWLRDVTATLRSSTDRPYIVRDKRNPGGVTLFDALRNCHCMVTHSSNAAVEALLYGIPVFCTNPCAGYAMGQPDITKIEAPRYPEREQWAWNLAANQWTLNEMKSGKCWKELNA
jgi:hypothetical protein